MKIMGESGLSALCSKIKGALSQNLQTVYPVGAVFLSVAETDPSTTFGFGTWENTGVLSLSDSDGVSTDVYLWTRTA